MTLPPAWDVLSPRVPSDPENPASASGAPRPSVFISYASENREAARLLRDALAAGGLDVWYDENELSGGDAWDQKIRRQIRECTYFLPVISAQTEARREGYFRREWRLAVDRSHDMADDAMFLIPVVIDQTTEAGARVPEKFATVQWLKCPGGVATPALKALAARLAAGEHSSLPPVAPPSIAQARRPIAAPPPPKQDAAAQSGPPPMPPFPHKPVDRHDRLKYLMEVLWWLIWTAWSLFKRMPKWLRILLILWFVFGVVLKSCNSDSGSPKGMRPSDTKDQAEKAQSLRDTATKLDKLASDPAEGNLKSGLAKAGAEIVRAVSQDVEDELGWKGQIELEPFTGGDADAQKLADEVFGRVFSELSQTRPTQVRVRPASVANGDDAALATAAAKAGDDYIVLGRNSGSEFEVRLLKADTAAALWTGHFSLESGTPSEVSEQICQGLMTALRKKPSHP